MVSILNKHFEPQTEEYRKAQFFLNNLIIVTIICSIFAIASLFSPIYQKISYMPFVGLCLLLLFIFIKTGNINICVNIAVIGCFLVLIKPITQTSGVSSQFYAWLILPPLIAVTLSTIRAGIIWFLVSILFEIAFYLADNTPLTELYTQMDKFNIMLNRICLSIIIMSTLISYERLKQKQQETIKHHLAEMNAQQEALTKKNEELERFAYVASHDLRTPLRNIISFGGLLNRRLKDHSDDSIHQFLGYINNYAHHMNSIIDNILDYARIEKTDMAPNEIVDMGDVWQTVTGLLNDRFIEKNATVRVEGDMPKVLAQQMQIVQLLQNLTENALTYNTSPQPEITFGHTKTDLSGQACFFIKDNGIGIEPKFQEKVFDMFYRLHSLDKFPGTGLGLAICKKIVQRYGGSIWLESQEGQGTTIYFTLPTL
ncbi:MAG: hypothetical protein IT258_24085 [Saprospiraceae bacterium]|nr:hypothetical protein [Saprospiraceae bacterium]